MAKRRGAGRSSETGDASGSPKPPTKSDAIRQMIAEIGNLPAPVIQSKLAEQGVETSLGMVYQIKGKIRRGRRGRKPRGQGGPQLQELVEVKNLADKLGGLDRLRNVTDALSRLRD